MKKFKLLSLMAMFIFGAMIFTACEEDTDPIGPNVPAPNAPSMLRATSANATSVLLRWDASVSEDSSWFSGYELTIVGGSPMSAKMISKTQPYTVSGLEEGVTYTFTLKAVNSENVLSTGSTSVTWSPASRFETTDIKMYSFKSSMGSGLSLYDNTNMKPMNLKAVDKTKWHIGIDDRTDGALWFGSASKIDIGTGTPVEAVEIADSYWDASELNTIFDKAALNTMVFESKRINLLQLDGTTGVVFVVRVMRQGQTTWNYAKVLVERGTGGFLQGTGDDKYVSMKISYQKVAGVPFAKISE